MRQNARGGSPSSHMPSGHLSTHSASIASPAWYCSLSACRRSISVLRTRIVTYSGARGGLRIRRFEADVYTDVTHPLPDSQRQGEPAITAVDNFSVMDGYVLVPVRRY